MSIVSYLENLLVKKHRGTMPIILTCPHGGSESPPGVQERDQAKTPRNCDFTKNSDLETNTITEGIAKRILQLTGLSPYVVVAKFHRKFIDANRSVRCAFNDPDAKPFYEEYHDSISKYVGEVLEENNNRGFLFDIHGVRQIEEEPADIYLGTSNGRTLQPDFQRSNLFKRHGLHGLLTAARHPVGEDSTTFQYVVSPQNESVRETQGVSGGFTVREYASSGINCIQIEIADTLRRNDEKRGLITEDLAFSMINFVRRYAPF